MKAAVITFPGSNCDRDLAVAFDGAGFDVARVWHKDTALPQGVDVVVIPGGFSFGDYLRCGAIAAQSPISAAIRAHAQARAAELAYDHQRVKAATRGEGATTEVAPVLPADVIGLFVLVPEAN